MEVTARNTERLLTDCCQEGRARLLIPWLAKKGHFTMTISLFPAALGSEVPPADRAKDMDDLYGRLLGSWEMDIIRHLDDASAKTELCRPGFLINLLQGVQHMANILAGDDHTVQSNVSF